MINFGARMLLNIPTETLQRVAETKQNKLMTVPNVATVVYADVDNAQVIISTDKETTSDKTNLNYVDRAIRYLSGRDKQLEADMQKALGKSLASQDLYISEAPTDSIWS